MTQKLDQEVLTLMVLEEIEGARVSQEVAVQVVWDRLGLAQRAALCRAQGNEMFRAWLRDAVTARLGGRA